MQKPCRPGIVNAVTEPSAVSRVWNNTRHQDTPTMTDSQVPRFLCLYLSQFLYLSRLLLWVPALRLYAPLVHVTKSTAQCVMIHSFSTRVWICWMICIHLLSHHRLLLSHQRLLQSHHRLVWSHHPLPHVVLRQQLQP